MCRVSRLDSTSGLLPGARGRLFLDSLSAKIDRVAVCCDTQSPLVMSAAMAQQNQSETNKEKSSSSAARFSEQHKTRFFFPLKRFLVFQFKLYVDAFRDLVLSALSLFAFILDVVLMHEPEESLFDKVLGMGRCSERAINLFNQHDKEQEGPVSIDGLVDEMEERLKRQQP